MGLFGIGKRHKGKVTGGISYEKPRPLKPPKVKKAPTKAQLKAKRVSQRKTKKQVRRIWRKLI